MRAQKNTDTCKSNVPRVQGPRVRVEDDVGRVRSHQGAKARGRVNGCT